MCAQHGGSLSPECSSDALEPVQHPLQQDQVGTVASVGRPVDHDQALVSRTGEVLTPGLRAELQGALPP